MAMVLRAVLLVVPSLVWITARPGLPPDSTSALFCGTSAEVVPLIEMR